MQIELLHALIFEIALNFADYIVKSEGIANTFNIIKVLSLYIADKSNLEGNRQKKLFAISPAPRYRREYTPKIVKKLLNQFLTSSYPVYW